MLQGANNDLINPLVQKSHNIYSLFIVFSVKIYHRLQITPKSQ